MSKDYSTFDYVQPTIYMTFYRKSMKLFFVLIKFHFFEFIIFIF